MAKLSLHDGPEAFDVSLLEAPAPARVVLFAVGGGGDPGRHLPLLEALVARGCTVVAPHFERFTSPFPMERRSRRARPSGPGDMVPLTPRLVSRATTSSTRSRESVATSSPKRG